MLKLKSRELPDNIIKDSDGSGNLITHSDFKTNLDDFLNCAKSFIGAKWRHRGRKPWAVDCAGIVILSLQAGGFPFKDRVDYGREPWKDGLEKALQDSFGLPLPVSERKAGDIVLMQDFGQPAPAHVGIITKEDTVIHSYSEMGVVEHNITEVWTNRMICVYRPNWD